MLFGTSDSQEMKSMTLFLRIYRLMIKQSSANQPLLKDAFILALKIGALKILFTSYFRGKMETIPPYDKNVEDIY